MRSGGLTPLDIRTGAGPPELLGIRGVSGPRGCRTWSGPGTGLTAMTQQVAAAVGIPVLSSIAATQSMELTGIHLALSVDVAVTLASVVLLWLRLRPRGEHRTAGAPSPASASDLSAGRAHWAGTRDVFRRPRREDVPAVGAAARAHVDEVVGGGEQVQVGSMTMIVAPASSSRSNTPTRVATSSAELRAFTGAQAWPRVVQLPACAPDLNPAGRHLVRAQARRARQPRRRQLRSPGPGHPARPEEDPVPARLIEGCLAGTGLALEREHTTDITN
jgi:hypothetical protein